MKYVFSGPALGKVLRENAIRIAKGELVVAPFEEAVNPEEGKGAAVTDSKYAEPADTKTVKKSKKKN